MQRFVKTLKLVDNPEAISGYCEAHDKIWPEITAGIRSVGITSMDIYLLGNLAVMIMEAPDGLDVGAAMEKLAKLPRQEEWEAFVSKFQECSPTDTSDEKWKLMDKVFSL